MNISTLLAIAGASLALFSVAPVRAEGSFTGASIAIGAGAVRNHIEYGEFLDGESTSHTAVVGRVDLSYGFDLTPRWIANIGATYDLNKTDAGTVHFTDNSASFDSVNKVKDHLSIYVAPGYRFGSDWLGYAKLGWHSAKVELNDGEIGRYETRHSGFGYGVGIATALTPHLELRFELGRVDFNRNESEDTTAKPDQTDALVYIGYRF